MFKKENPLPSVSGDVQKPQDPIMPTSTSSVTEPTHVSPGTTVKGDIFSSGMVNVEGKVEGSVSAQGDVKIGPQGDITGEVEGKNVTIAGRLKGKAFADDKVHLLRGAHVDGDIHAQSLKIDDAVVFNGGCNMGQGARKRRSEIKTAPPSTVVPIKAAA